ncbi:MAG: DUF3516 domain-containing protein [Deltaproteobacteria bacterium]|nr:DUF3516 domain-containing protein [Deltaproteobacteria bacterium]
MTDAPANVSSALQPGSHTGPTNDGPTSDGPPSDGPPRLVDRIPDGGTRDPDLMLDLFLEWAGDLGFSLYPAQEEALLELMAGRHVILNTPTGSGKSLVATGLHFKGLCEQKRSFYTSPIKALASEKFFALCDDFGAENVGMLTGDASINPQATIICCTAEVLSNMVLRKGEGADAPYVVMDEFHYYADRDRGAAWQIPLITLESTKFLLMSATLGNTSRIEQYLAEQTTSEVSLVRSDDRPVPLDFEYRQTPLHETVQRLLDQGKSPIYIVNFTQRECAELAQSLTSMQITTKEEKRAVLDALKGFRFDTSYGKEMRRFLTFGIAVHHAGLLPKYRLLVEQLSQQSLLKVICGTDTLGVGVNIPIRTVLFTKLCKYDGSETKILSVRDFKQISGRAGRKGFDDRGSVVCQAPEHVIENLRLVQKAAKSGKKKIVRRKPPQRGYVHWDEQTFQGLIEKPPETLKPSFRLTHGMVFNLIQRDADSDASNDNFTSLRELLKRCHEDDASKKRLFSEAAVLVRSLYRADVIQTARDTQSNYLWVVVNEDLQWDFSLFHTLALFLVEILEAQNPDKPDYALDVMSQVEAILENPQIILRKQADRLKGELIALLKAEGVPYEERMERLEEVTHPKPNADQLYDAFNSFRELHPWVRGEAVKPKSIGREIFENYMSFADFIRRYGLQRSEGLLLRYLSQLYKTLDQTVPEKAKDEAIYDILGFFRAMLERIDNSLIEEWQSLLHPELRLASQEERQEAQQKVAFYELLHDSKVFAARVRAEMHQLVRELAKGNWEEAALCVVQETEDPWPAERFEAALTPFLEEYDQIVFTPDARQARLTTITRTSERVWKVAQVLLDPEEDNLWCIEAEVDLSDPEHLEGLLLRPRRIGL